MPGASFEAVTGRLGVGAVAFLGLFLLGDGLQIGVFEMIEAYGQSATWGLVGIVPTAVVTYIVGVICLGFAELVLSRFPAFQGPTVGDIVAVSRAGSPLLEQLFAEHVRNHELLKGAAVSFLVLAVGSGAEWRNSGGYYTLLWLAVFGAVGLSGLSMLFARRSAAQATALAAGAHAAGQAQAPGNLLPE
jgi:hypothetical protein